MIHVHLKLLRPGIGHGGPERPRWVVMNMKPHYTRDTKDEVSLQNGPCRQWIEQLEKRAILCKKDNTIWALWYWPLGYSICGFSVCLVAWVFFFFFLTLSLFYSSIFSWCLSSCPLGQCILWTVFCWKYGICFCVLQAVSIKRIPPSLRRDFESWTFKHCWDWRNKGTLKDGLQASVDNHETVGTSESKDGF